MSFFRYPGGKKKFKGIILEQLNKFNTHEYREPFFGGGSIGLHYALDCPIWINDKDYGIFCLWESVRKYPNELKKLVKEYTPSLEDFYNFKEILLNNKSDDILLTGFMKLVIHQISYSGLGTKSGGPLGGKLQKSNYKIDCRWSPEYICKKIDNTHEYFKSYCAVRNTSLDYSELIKDEERISTIYLDPPYYIKGNDLYQCGFTHEDHVNLSNLLKNTPHNWVLSYDDCNEIKELYSWANIQTVNANYTITTSREKSELIITKE